MVPSEPDTLMTVMINEAQNITTQCGQQVTIFTCDQQLYRVMVNVNRVHPLLFEHAWGHVHVDEFCGVCWNINGEHWS